MLKGLRWGIPNMAGDFNSADNSLAGSVQYCWFSTPFWHDDCEVTCIFLGRKGRQLMWGDPKVLQIAMIQLGLMLLGSKLAVEEFRAKQP